MTGTREYILFTRGPPVNDLFPGDPQLRYGDPGVPFHPQARSDEARSDEARSDEPK